MKTKTADLVGPALDWAVAQCEMMREDYRDRGLLVHRIGYGQPMPPYSADWSQGGPVIESEKITLRVNAYLPGYWAAFIDFGGSNCNIKARHSGPTPLIAAMRCFVASRLGDEVDVPDELV